MHTVAFPTVVWSEDVLRHEPGAEIWVGVSTPGTEVPERASVLLDAVTAAGATVVNAQAYDDAVLHAVHDRALVDHLTTIAEQWSQGPYEELVGQDRVVPYVFPTEGMLDGLPAHEPAATHARAGLYCYDTMTLVGPGTWEAARAAVDVALTAADLVADGAASSYALVRPPGHHATRRAFGGSCYLNNAAVAAQRLRDRGAGRVAIVDVDAHHGNGTQAIFYDRADVFYGSLHVDPGAGWFPHFVGFADEQGRDAGGRVDVQPPAGARHRRRRVAGRARPAARPPRRVRSGGARGLAGRRRRRRRPGEPARGQHRRASAARGSGWPRWAGPPCSCTRAATSSRGWAWTRSRCSARSGRERILSGFGTIQDVWR